MKGLFSRVARSRSPRTALYLVAVSHCAFLFAGFFAPYSVDAQHRSRVFAPPQRIHVWDRVRHVYRRPFVYRLQLRADSFNEYEEDTRAAFPIHFFVGGGQYSVVGLAFTRHLFGTDEQAPIFLLGTDAYGRDEFSRFLYGGRLSLFAGLLAAFLSLSLALVLGGLAGFYGGWADELIMRGAELFLTVPWLYLLLLIRAFLPVQLDATRAFLILIAVLGLLGWARPARLIRGVVMSAKERDYVRAARGFGASDLYLLRRHILPYAVSVAITQLAVYIPQYVLAEVTLSFFGLGVGEPTPSWGNMLAGLQQPFALEACPWLFTPAIALIAVFAAYHRLLSYYSGSDYKI